MPTGNQYVSRKRMLLQTLFYTRMALHNAMPNAARIYLDDYHRAYALVPASTKRRWRCGR